MGDQNQADTIFLNDLRIETVVGIWDWERKIRQTVSIDLEMGADVGEAAAHDDIEHTLNYKAVAKRVQSFVGESAFQLGRDHGGTYRGAGTDGIRRAVGTSQGQQAGRNSRCT